MIPASHSEALVPAEDRESSRFGPMPFRRLVVIELRKSVDTRGGAGLLSVMSIISFTIMASVGIWGDRKAQSFGNLVDLANLPLMFLLPIVGTLLATQEWAARTGLMTFAFEPRRGRVVGAKMCASAMLGMFVAFGALLAAGVITAVAGLRWSFDGISLPGTVFALILLVIQGGAFGLALLNTTLAVVLSLLLPITWSLATPLIPAVREAAGWLELHRSLLQLSTGTMSAEGWLQLLAASVVWIGMPLLIGTMRVLRGELK